MRTIILVIIKVLFISALFIISNENLNIKDPEDRSVFFDLYSLWAKKVFNQSMEIAGYVVNSKWLPDLNRD
ncbi:MAG: hypothetical protein QXU40_00195 [Candidatus Pacearchaeota archaeon]